MNITFKNRAQAGRRLAHELERYRGSDSIVFAIPRGGVVTGFEIARALDLPLEIVVSRKIGHPTSPEYAVCAVDAKGLTLCNEEEINAIDAVWLKKAITEQQKEAQRREVVYQKGRARIQAKGKTIIIVDDGVATGLTIRLAILGLKAEGPARIIVALPVAPVGVAEQLKKEVDELILLSNPEDFLGAVGSHYERFEQVEDDEVIHLLELAASGK